MSKQSDKVFDRLRAIPKAVRNAVQPALVKSGNELAAAMRAAAPVDTGALRASIAVTPPGQATPAHSQPGGSRIAGENEVLVTAGNTHVRYPHFLEYGVVGRPAQPYFWPSYRAKKKRIQNRIKREISKAVKQAWEKP